MTKEVGVRGVLSVAHEPVNAEVFGGELHGHSYEIIAWFSCDQSEDARVYKAALDTLLKQWDHKVLPPALARSEDIAATIGVLAKCVEVEVRRPLEGYFARWRP